MKVKDIEVLHLKGTMVVSALQEYFGAQYRRLQGNHSEGEVFSKPLTHLAEDSCEAIGENGRSILCFRIIRQVHNNTIRAILRRHGNTDKLASGRWYEVHGD